MTGMAAGTQGLQGSDPAGMTMDEIEASLKAQEEAAARPDLTKITADDPSLPENLRGKTVQEILAHTKAVEEALRVSESSRQQAMILAQQAQNQQNQQPAAPAAPVEEPITADMIAEAFQEDPAKGAELMFKANQQAIDRAASNFSKRLEPMFQSSVSTMEAEARRRYPDEFELYKDEIQSLMKDVPNPQQVFSQQKSWDDLVAYVRGRDPDKLFNYRMQKQGTSQQQQAQTQQREAVGYQSVANQRAPAPSAGGPIFDPVVDDVCRVMGITREEYAKWAKVGG